VLMSDTLQKPCIPRMMVAPVQNSTNSGAN
jgi:hypothetical protein